MIKFDEDLLAKLHIRIPEIEITDFEELKVYAGKQVLISDDHAGHNGRTFRGTVEPAPRESPVRINISHDQAIFLDQRHFDSGVKVYPIVKEFKHVGDE
jgi:hypothetical protein